MKKRVCTTQKLTSKTDQNIERRQTHQGISRHKTRTQQLAGALPIGILPSERRVVVTQVWRMYDLVALPSHDRGYLFAVAREKSTWTLREPFNEFEMASDEFVKG